MLSRWNAWLPVHPSVQVPFCEYFVQEKPGSNWQFNSVICSPFVCLQQFKHAAMLPFFNLQYIDFKKKTKTVAASAVFFNHSALSTTYNILLHLRVSVCLWLSRQRYPLAELQNGLVADVFVSNHNFIAKYLFSNKKNNVQNWNGENY